MSSEPSDHGRVRRLLAKVDGRNLGASEWLRSGWPRGFPLLLLVALPLALAGPIRFVTGAGIGFAFALATVVVAIAVMPFVPALRATELTWKEAIAANVVVVLAGAFAVWIIYNGDFGGLVSYVARDAAMPIDAATHVQLYHAFTKQTPDVYQGFVSLYGFWDPLRRVAGDLIFPATLSYLLCGFVVAAAPCVVVFSILRNFRANARAYFVGAAVCLAGVIVVQYVTILPLEVVHHMSGFWGHMFGLVPLMSLWMVDTLVRQRMLRVAAILFVVAIYRYTYGLNLTDVLVAVGLVLVVEAIGDSRWRARMGFGLGALAVIAAGVFSYSQLVPILRKWGWLVAHDPPRVWQGQVIALAALAATVCLPPRDVASRSGILRALRFPFLFGFVNVVLLVVTKQFTTTKYYYYQKYSFHAVVLVASALVVVAAYWAALVASRGDRRILVCVCVVLVLATFSQLRIRRGFASYQEGFQEYVHGPPYRRAQPWYDSGGVAKMREVLRESGSAYGGYLATFWPMRSFTNALFEFDPDFYGPPDVDRRPGHCVFWEGGEFASYDRDATKQCSTYEQRWKPSRVGTLCWRCY